MSKLDSKNFLLGLLVIAFILAWVTKIFFGDIGLYFMGGLWAGFFLGVLIRNHLFRKSPHSDVYHLLETHPTLLDDIKKEILESEYYDKIKNKD